jgi:hypothetical protein
MQALGGNNNTMPIGSGVMSDRDAQRVMLLVAITGYYANFTNEEKAQELCLIEKWKGL